MIIHFTRNVMEYQWALLLLEFEEVVFTPIIECGFLKFIVDMSMLKNV